MNNIGQIKNAYLVSVIGIALMVITTAYGAVRALLIRQMFQTGGVAVGSGVAVGRRQFGMNPFGLTNIVNILALVIAIAGIVWLGLALRKPRSTKALAPSGSST